MAIKVTYIKPINQSGPDVPPLTLDPSSGVFYNSGDEVPMSAELRDYLSNWFIFTDKSGDVVDPDPSALGGVSAPASTVPLVPVPETAAPDSSSSSSAAKS